MVLTWGLFRPLLFKGEWNVVTAAYTFLRHFGKNSPRAPGLGGPLTARGPKQLLALPVQKQRICLCLLPILFFPPEHVHTDSQTLTLI